MSDEEFAAFKCRPGQYYQYGVSDGGQGHAIDWNEYASASNNYAGCFPDMRLPCKRTDNVCKMETDWHVGRDGPMHVFTMNSIPGKTPKSGSLSRGWLGTKLSKVAVAYLTVNMLSKNSIELFEEHFALSLFISHLMCSMLIESFPQINDFIKTLIDRIV